MVEKVTARFKLDETYTKRYSKEDVIKLIENCYDEEFILTFIPRGEYNADVLIRSTPEYLSSHNLNNTSEVQDGYKSRDIR